MKVNRFYFFTIPSLVVLFLVSGGAAAKDYYVQPAVGSNTNSGLAPDKAFGGLIYALKQLQPGDTLYLREGTYTRFPELKPSHHASGTRADPIVLRSYNGERAVISTPSAIRLVGGISGWTFKDLVFENSQAVKLGVRKGRECKSFAQNIIFRWNTFQHSNDSGIVLHCVRHIRIKENTFWNLRSRKVGSDRHAILTTASAESVEIVGNRFTDIGADGVQLVGAIEDIDILDNEFEIVHPYRYRDVDGEVPSPGGKRFRSVGENAIDIKGGPGPVTIANNVIHGYRPVIKGVQDASGDMGVGIVLHQDTKQVFIRRNYFYDNVININIGKPAGGAVISHNILGNVVRADADIYGKDTQVPKNLLLKGIDGLDIYNNVFHNDEGGSNKTLLRSIGASNIVLRNNVFRNGRIVATDTKDVFAKHNAWSGIKGNVPPMFRDQRDVLDNPDIDWSDWRPLNGSPVIDAGITVSAERDFYGNPVFGEMPDIGAVEFLPPRNGDSVTQGKEAPTQ